MNPELPKIDFTTFVLSVSSAAFMGLGLVPREQGGKAEVDLVFAKQNIDLLEMIQDKTRGNLDDNEKKLLEQVLFETRMRFVQMGGQSASPKS